jgi:membrane-bound serine protease (ClpP class)
MALALGIAGFFLLPQPWNVLAVVLAASIEVGEIFLWIKFLSRYRITTGAEGMIGELAVVQAPLDPRGRVTFRGEGWRAVSVDGRPIGVREPVKVVAVEGLTLTVAVTGTAHVPPRADV